MEINLTTKTFEQLLEDNNFGYKYIIDNYKPEKSKKGKVEIELWYPKKITTNQEFLNYCKQVGARPASFNEALQFSKENPELQKKYPLITFDINQLCCLYLSRSGGLRSVLVLRASLGGDWSEGVRFLLVREYLDSSKLGSSVPLELGDLKLEYKGRKFKIVEE